MSVLDNNTIGTLGSNIDVGEMLLPDNHIALVAEYSGWCYPYSIGGVRLNTTFQGSGTIACVFINGNNIFSQVCMLLGLGAAAYRLDDGAFLNVQQADVDTIGIVDGQEVECQHQAPRIIRFQKIKNRLV
jgi:hypothetical protein